MCWDEGLGLDVIGIGVVGAKWLPWADKPTL
jgi:hypothetical protein